MAKILPKGSSCEKPGKSPLRDWVVVDRNQGAVRCEVFGQVIYVAKDNPQAAKLRRSRDRQVFTRQELAGRVLRGMSEDQMRGWLEVVLPVKRVFPGARVEKVTATR